MSGFSFTLTPAQRRSAAYSAVFLVLSSVYFLWTPSTPPTVGPVVSGSTEATERLLTRLRQVAATVPQKEEILKGVQADLAKREAGFIAGDTAAQAQAQVLQTLRRLCASSTPPIDIRNVELGAVTPLGDSYGAANVAIQVDCPIEQLVNLLTAIAAQPELIYTNELRLTSQNNPKEKTVSVRVGVTGVVSRALVPGKGNTGKEKSKKGTSGL